MRRFGSARVGSYLRFSSAATVSASAAPPLGTLAAPTRALLAGRRSFQPFSEREEEELVKVLSTKPKHVARHIRQNILQSSRHIAQFRNAVTYLMIMLQSKLQKKEINPADAAQVIQGIMIECVATRQGDMAHLLFRAAVRFRKYGLQLTTETVKTLFDCYRGSQAKELMETLANELRDDPDMRPIVMAAYIFAGNIEAAKAIKAATPREQLTTEDFCAILEGLGVIGLYSEMSGYVKEAFEVQEQVDLPRIASTAVSACRRDLTTMTELYRSSANAGIPLSQECVAHIVRARLYPASTLEEVYTIEKELREELGTDSFGLGAETAILSRCSDLVAQFAASVDDTMLTRVEHLRAVVESAEDVDPQYVMALLRGYGALGKVDEMNALFENFKRRFEVDPRVYDEVLRWNSNAENIKDVIKYKDEMSRLGIRHSSLTYINVFKCLDKFYPRMVEKYYNEMIARGLAVDSRMYPVLLHVFGDIGDMAMVEQLYNEMRIKSSQGLEVFSPKSTRVLLNIFKGDEVRCEEIIEQAASKGHLANESSKHALMKFYSKHNRVAEMLDVAQNMVRTAETYRVLLRHYAARGEKLAFEDTLREMRESCTAFDDETVRVLITTYSRWGDAAKVRNVLADAAAIDGVHNAHFYADAAAAFARVGDMEAMDHVWDDLTQSKVSITMSVFNKFLDLYMAVNNMDRVQTILNHMMATIPPNPVTATTVVDMLGKMGRLNEMEALLDEMAKSKNAAPTVVTYHQAMSAYAKVGDVAKVELIRRRMEEAQMPESAITYNILVEAYGRAKRYEHIADLVQERRSKGIAMDEFGFIGLINTYARARLADEVNDVVASLQGSQIGLSSRLLSVIATAYSFIGDLAKVEHYVELLLAHPSRRQRDVEAVFMMYSRLRDTAKLQTLLDTYPRTEFVYNICIGSFAKSGDYVKVASLLQEMEQRKMTLQRNTSITLSSLLLKAGKVELAQAVLNWRHVSLGSGAASDASVSSGAAVEELERGKELAASDDPDAGIDNHKFLQEQIKQGSA